MESFTGDEKRRYYGWIDEIWELDYSGEAKVAMFHVRWAKNVDTEDGYFTTMTIPEAQPVGAPSNVKGITAQYEPWVFAKDVDYFFL